MAEMRMGLRGAASPCENICSGVHSITLVRSASSEKGSAAARASGRIHSWERGVKVGRHDEKRGIAVASAM